MNQNNVEKLLETVNSFVRDLHEINEATDQRTVAEIERRAVNKLQLAIVEVEMAGRDLYAIASRRKGQIRRGEVNADNQSTVARGSKPKATRKAK